MEMTAKEYLMQHRIAINRIKRKQEQIDKLREDLLPSGISYTGMPGGGGEKTYADLIAKIDELERQLRAEQSKAAQIADGVISVIESVDDEMHRAILHDRYILRMRWDDIAEKENKDVRWIYRIHGRALQEIEKKLKLTSESQY